FALLDAGPRRCEVDDVGAQHLAGELEGRSRPRRSLVEDGDNCGAAKRRHARNFSGEHLFHRVGRREHELNLVPREVVEVEDMTSTPDLRLPRRREGKFAACGRRGCGSRGRAGSGHRYSSLVTTATSSRPSVSASRTWISSARLVGTFLPT